MITFRKQSAGTWTVYDGDRLAGTVRRETAWTVRGDKVLWVAYRKGRSIGEKPTRKAAGELLKVAK